MLGHPIFISLQRSNVHSSLSIVICLRGYLWTAPSMLAKGIKTKDGSGGRVYPGGLVSNGSPTQEPSPTVQSLPSGQREPAAVIQASPRRGSSAAATTAALCLSRPALGSVSPGESKAMSSKVTPSSPKHSPVCRANVTMTWTLLRRSSNAVTPSVCIPRPRPRNLSFSASETFDATAVVISVIPPLNSHSVFEGS